MEWQKGMKQSKLPINKQPEGHMMLAQLAERILQQEKQAPGELYIKLVSWDTSQH